MRLVQTGTEVGGFTVRLLESVLIVVVLMLALIAVGGCSSKTPTAPETPNGTSPASSPTVGPNDPEDSADGPEDRAVGYFANGEKVVPVRLDANATDRESALEQLFAGPTAEALAVEYTSEIPAGTRLLGLDIDDGKATIDVSDEFGSGGGSLSMMLRVAQVVFTLTREPDVQRVVFKINGKPVEALGGEGILLDEPQTRDDWEDFSPAVLIEAPVLGDTVASPVTITGTANVFEAVFQISVRGAGDTPVADQVVQATSGTGTRGTFSAQMPFNLPSGTKATLVAWYASPKDGAAVEVMQVPVAVE